MVTNRRNGSKSKLAASIVPLLLVLALMPGVKAQAPAGTETSAAFDNVLTLADAGAPGPIVLRGLEATRTVYFSVPPTEVVKTAMMKLRYQFSPGLVAVRSQLKVSLNSTLVATLPVPVATENNALLETMLTLPAAALARRNELRFEFSGHYAESCEDPSSATLWSHIDATSSIELAGELLPLQNELKLLPLPFYDAGTNLHPPVPIVFISQPSAKAMQAGGIVASWFGILGNSHIVRFPVTIGSWLPQGNVIVISESTADLPALLGISGTSGPTIAMRSNPSDPESKALVLTGDNADDLLAAAQTLALNSGSLAGATQGVRPTLAKKRDPDDAPRWLSTDHLTTFGEIAQQDDLQGDGSAPIQTDFRMPPDLYLNYGSRQNLKFQLDYRYNGIPLANDSSLQVYLNDAFVGSAPMPHTDTVSRDLSAAIPLPIVNLRPFSNSMKMRFSFQTAKTGGCPDIAPANLQGAILKSSTLDIRGVPHWAQMPNLEIFANAGYPFTRLADLAETVIVLPDQPSSEELEMYLTLMEHFGAQTGYPVLNVTVTNADGMKTDSGKDYLLMGTVDDLSGAIAKVSDNLPVKVSSGGLKIEGTQGFFANAWWKVPSSDRTDNGKLEVFGGALPDALFEGIEWPRGSGKSLVLIALRDKSVVSNFLSVFLKSAQSSDVSHSVSVLKGERFVSYRVGNDAYHVGSLPWWIQANLWAQQYPWVPAVVAVFVCFLMAVLLRAKLRRRARRRLLGEV